MKTKKKLMLEYEGYKCTLETKTDSKVFFFFFGVKIDIVKVKLIPKKWF